ncbi:MAG: hypothetical protein QNJ70_05065 [Xenococcaceae cyanobacterium MO_207.B15]|nr:hypothetical protein [Xenococcaceae cyanobacterium MO_207.B15]
MRVYINNNQPGLSVKVKPSIASINAIAFFFKKIFIISFPFKFATDD